ncbi:uncharacterized protein LOC143286048 [Babylonia areolata]|uniref:uncharacterized protein LOC143286048 n=1 Tax=Babylonia areolata TaxID=304850 RepID=UPI003FCF1E87
MLTMDACLNNSLLTSNMSEEEDEGVLDGEGEDVYMRELAQQVKYYVLKRFIPVISALGVLGNFLSLLVLTKEKLHKVLSKMEISANIGLIALAVSDICLCLMVLLVTTLPLQDVYRPGQLLIYFHLMSSGLITMFIITSTWLIVVMAAERYVAVCHPLKARNLILLWRSRAYVILLFVLCPLCTVPIFLESYIQEVACVDGTVLYRVDTVSRESMVLRRFVWAMAFDFIPCAALIFFNTCLIWKIHKAKQLRDKMAPLQSRSQSSSHNSVQKFRWDGSNTTAKNSSSRRSGQETSEVGGDKRLQKLRGSKAQQQQQQRETIVMERVELSESSVSQQPCYNGGVGDRRGEKQLLCQQGKNGMVKTSSRRATNTHRKDRSLSSKRRSSDNALHSVTATLVAVVLTFLLLVSPWELLKFAMQYSSTPMDRYKMDIAVYLTNLLQVLNFSFNFVLYCLVNKSFRRTLRSIICPQFLSQCK